jgi:hypothetical protein
MAAVFRGRPLFPIDLAESSFIGVVWEAHLEVVSGVGGGDGELKDLAGSSSFNLIYPCHPE